MTAWFRNPEVIFPTIYNYHAETKEYLGEGRSDPSPLEEGVFADSAHSTRVAPPAFNDRQKPIWDGRKWTIVADRRGETWFDRNGHEVEIKDLGNPSENGLFTEKPLIPEPEPTIDDLLAYAAARRYEFEIAGIVFKGFKITTDDRSKNLINGLRIKAEADPAYTTEWKSDAGAFVTINAKTVIAISDAVLKHVAGCFAQESAVTARIKNGAITTKAQINDAFGEAA